MWGRSATKLQPTQGMSTWQNYTNPFCVLSSWKTRPRDGLSSEAQGSEVPIWSQTHKCYFLAVTKLGQPLSVSSSHYRGPSTVPLYGAPFTFAVTISLHIYYDSFLAGDCAGFKERAAKRWCGLGAELPLPNPHKSPSQPREHGTHAYVT